MNIFINFATECAISYRENNYIFDKSLYRKAKPVIIVIISYQEGLSIQNSFRII